MTSLEEHRALRDDDARHDAEPVTREEGIRWCQQALARFAPDDDRLHQLEPHGAGNCQECDRHTLSLRQLGSIILCVDCILRRLRAHAKSEPLPRTRAPEPQLPQVAV